MFFLQCYTNISPCCQKHCFSSAGAITWKAAVLIPVIASSALVFFLRMQTKKDFTMCIKCSNAEIGFSCFSAPPTRRAKAKWSGLSQNWFHPNPQSLSQNWAFIVLAAFRSLSWAHEQEHKPELAVLTGGHSSHCLCKPTPGLWQNLTQLHKGFEDVAI